MDAVGGDVYAVALFELEVVHGDEGNDGAVVGVVVLLYEAREEIEDVCVLAVFFTRDLK